jgi:hypothetical protein
MTKTLLIAIACIAHAFVAHTQSGYQVQGNVVDATTGLPVEQCNVRVQGTLQGTSTNQNGQYKIVFSQKPDTFSLQFSHVNYVALSKNGLALSGGKLQLNITMQPLSEAYPEVIISSAPDTVWGSKELNVADFAFCNKNMLLLTYENEERWKRQEDAKTTLYSGCKLVLLDSNHAEIYRKPVSGLAIGFYLNYLNEIFLQCKEEIFQVACTESTIEIAPYPKSDFELYIEPVVDTLANAIYFSNYNAHYPAFEYLRFNKADSSYTTVRYLINEELMQRFRAQYRDLGPKEKLDAFRKEVQTGIDKEIYGAYMTGFTHTPYYQPLNIPMLTQGDTLLIFDHVHNKLVRYNNENAALDSALIDYHTEQKNMRWGQSVIKDQAKNNIYTWHNKAGFTYLKSINTTNGLALYVCKLNYKYSDKIKVHNGCAYYIYRPFESSQNRFLYKEKLPAY